MRNATTMRMVGQFVPFGMQQSTGMPLRRGRAVTVTEWETGLLFRHGRFEQTLTPGRHRRWGSGYTIRTVDTRPYVLLVPTQEVPTSDGASVKVTVAGQARVADAVSYVTTTREADQTLYLAIQVALRELVATTSIEDLLANRAELGERLLASVEGVAEVGLALDRLELKDIILSAELKRAQAEVLVARAQGLAALERARGETAALRSLANAARLAAENPAMLQLRMLQQLDASTGHTVVIGTTPLPVTAAGPKVS